MTSDAIAIIRLIFNNIWSLYTTWAIPGTDTTPAAWSLYLLVSWLAIRFIKRTTFDHVRDGGTRDD